MTIRDDRTLDAEGAAVTEGDATSEPGAEDAARRAALGRAVAQWSGELVDLGGRNTLLYFRDLRVGSLDLADAEPGALDDLLDGGTVALSRLYPDADTRLAVAKRCRAVRAKARENQEERGLRTLFLGVGAATWTNHRGTALPNAPVLLRPMALTPRGGAAEDFDLVAVDEWEVNPTLVHLLRTDFSVTIDADAVLGPELEPDDGIDPDSDPDPDRIDPEAVFGRLADLAAAVPGFAITPRVLAANLSYAKLPMVQDLEASFDALCAHPLVCALAGSEIDRARLRDAQAAAAAGIDAALPDRTEPAAEFLVLDADASQHRVVNLAVAGANLVVQGPPGTGKSQTISNLVATLVAHGRSVLFVAEKRAAIDAVTKRLDGVGLGDLVLDLHDGAASRTRLAADLARAFGTMGQIPAPDQSAVQRTLTARRATLNDHARALHEVRMPWGVSVFTLQAERTGVAPEHRTDLRLFGDALATLDATAYAAAGDGVAEWLALDGPAVLAGTRPWAAAADRVPTSDDALRLQQVLGDLRSQAFPDARRQVADVCGSAGVRPPASTRAAASTLDLLQRVNTTLDDFAPSVYDADLTGVIADLEPGARGGFGALLALLFRPRYRAARRAGTALRQPPASVPTRALRPALVGADAQRAQWAADATDGGSPRRTDGVEAAIAALARLDDARRVLGEARDRPPDGDATFDEIAADLDVLAADAVTLQRLPRIAALRAELAARGLGPFVVEIAARGLDATATRAALMWLRAESVLVHVATVDPRIGAFDGAGHDSSVTEFVAADRAQVAGGAVRVARATAEAALAARNAHPDQEAVLEKYARQKRRHPSIRDLMQQAPDVLLAVRPCWVMSPLVVAQLLPSGPPLFDVVVFDEASQIRPADAVVSLARGRQAVVAGDAKQLPPTRFFDVTTTTADDAADAADSGTGELDDAATPYTEDMDSILDALSVLLPPPHGSQTLAWHYRSRDERLIAFSNAQPALYGGSLTTFPGTGGDGTLRHVLVPHRPGVGGTVDSSTDEVDAVVELIREHARTRPDESLGVIAMGITHADRIAEALRLARRDDPVLDAAPCLDDLRAEDPFFVKNLERVQGDERDAIVLTIGYPKTADGRMQYRFGPLNQEGGERRLNVAITRARRRIAVVSAFTPEDMDDDRLRAEGARMLKRYLAYVRSGGTELGPHAEIEDPLDAFEADVELRLARAGIPVVARYGVSGSWIDVAARHPTDPGRMVLAIEADGPAYGAAPTARTRDRLRHEHLARLGWRHHRIWSTEWCRDPEREVARVRAAYDRALVPDATAAPPIAWPAAAVGLPVAPRRGPRPAVPAGTEIGDYAPDQLDALCRWITSDTLLRTDDELLEEMMRELGFARRGRQIVAALTASIARVRD